MRAVKDSAKQANCTDVAEYTSSTLWPDGELST